MLKGIENDGAFLIRHSSSKQDTYSISFRGQNMIWHYQLKRNGRLFVVNDNFFENLVTLVEFYQQNPFANGVRLGIPVNQENFEKLTDLDSATRYIYRLNVDQEVEAIALEAYEGTEKDHLSFPSNAVIKIISKDNNFNKMWQGIYGDKVGFFPPQCVKELGNNMGRSSRDTDVVFRLDNCSIEKVMLWSCVLPPLSGFGE